MKKPLRIDPAELFTTCELQVLRIAWADFNNKNIAAMTGKGLRTIDTQRAKVIRKTRRIMGNPFAGITSAFRLGLALKLLEMPTPTMLNIRVVHAEPRILSK